MKTTSIQEAMQLPRRLTFTRIQSEYTGTQFWTADFVKHEDILVELDLVRFDAGVKEVRIAKTRYSKLWEIQIMTRGQYNWETYRTGYSTLRDAMSGADLYLNPNHISPIDNDYDFDAAEEHFTKQARQGLKKAR